VTREIEMTQFSNDVVYAFIEFVYCGNVSQKSRENLNKSHSVRLDLFDLACQYFLRDLTEMLGPWILKTLTEANATDTVVAMSKFLCCDDKLIVKCVSEILEKALEVFKNSSRRC
jgi:hypothetical protein